MKKLSVIAVFLAVISVFACGVQAQGNSTMLALHASWDNGFPVSGTVTVAQMNAGGSGNTVLSTKNLTFGATALSMPLAANAFYTVTVTSAKGTQLISFPFTTALINTANLQNARILLVFNSRTKTVKSATITVGLDF